MGDLKLGIQLGYWTAKPPDGRDLIELAQTAEGLGYDSVWTGESWSSDAFSPLVWVAAHTSRINLATGIAQMSARSPVTAAMHAMTLDALSGGRFRLGVGVSGPQVVEGWYGQPFERPLARTREYVQIIREIVARERPVEFTGEHYTLPYPGGTGLGEPLKSTLHPRRTEIPIYLGAEGPKNVAMTAEIADGWLPIFFAPKDNGFYRAALDEGFARPGARHTIDDFEVPATVIVVPIDDIEQAADMVRPFLALYIGGMGARDTNFHFEVFSRMGHEGACVAIQDAYLDGRKDDAIAAVPTAMVEDIALVGSVDKIRDELQRWEETVVTTLLLSGPPDLLELMADLVG